MSHSLRRPSFPIRVPIDHGWPNQWLQFDFSLKAWGGTGVENQVLIGYRVHIKLCQKTLASLAKWSIVTKVWYMCLRQCHIFHGHRIFQQFYRVTSFKSINIFFEIGKYRSWPNTLPFQVGYWVANTRTPGSDPSTRYSPFQGKCKTPIVDLLFRLHVYVSSIIVAEDTFSLLASIQRVNAI